MRRALSVIPVALLSGIVALVLASFVGGCAAGSSSELSRTTSTFYSVPTIPEANQVEWVGEVEAKQGIGNLIISGKIRNRGDHPLVHVEIRGTGFDKSGATVSTNTSVIDILAPGATATFTVYVDDPNHEATQGVANLVGAYLQN